MMTFQQARMYFEEELSGLYDPEEAFSLFLAYFDMRPARYITDQLLPVKEENTVKKHVELLKAGKPVQQIRGWADFFNLKFLVNEHVLIPRPETEELVDWILAATKDRNAVSLLDIGTGSGCIPVTYKVKKPDAKVTALDVSAAALEVARKNGKANGTVITWLEADILHFSLPMKYDVIVSNPPYITHAEKSEMHKNVLEYEPHTALFVPDEDPLLFYKAIVNQAVHALNTEGFLFFELNAQFGREVVELMEAAGFKEIELRKDMQGKERMVSGRWYKI